MLCCLVFTIRFYFIIRLEKRFGYIFRQKHFLKLINFGWLIFFIGIHNITFPSEIGLLFHFCACRQRHQESSNSVIFTEVGTNNIIPKAQRNKAQQSFQTVKAQCKMHNLIFLISEAQRNFHNELFDSVEVQRNSTIAERHFRTTLKRNLPSTILKISQHNANTAFFLQF